jgi:nucleotide-binding universal stress UspA family protein
MKIEKILFHTNFRELAYNALEAGMEIQKAGLKTVVLVHVIPREEVAFVPYGGYLKDEEERLAEIARTRFENWQEAITDRGLNCKIRIETGNLNARLLSVAEEEGADWIVTGKKKRSTFEKVYVGEHILDLLRRSPVPILMGKYLARYEFEGEVFTRVNDHPYDRPLLATDWSEPSERALELLASFKGLSKKVLVTHVIGAKLSKGLESEALDFLKMESRKRLEEYCRKLRDAGLEAEPLLSMGKTAAEIVRLSRSYSATMIAMGRTGKDWFQQYWLGGVSHRVAETSELPVLLVP